MYSEKIYIISAFLLSIVLFIYGCSAGMSSSSTILFFGGIYFLSWCFIKDPFSPVILFGLFLFFYTVSWPMLLIIGGIEDASTIQKSNVILSSGILVFCGILLSSLFSFKVGKCFKVTNELKTIADNSNISLYLAIMFFPAFLLSIYEVITSEATLKYEMDTSGLTGVLVYFFLTFSFVYFASRQKKNFLFVSVFVLMFFIYYLFTGQRDLFVRAFLMALLLFYTKEKVSKKGVLFLFLAGFVFLPVSQSLKGILSYGRGEFSIDGMSFLSFFSGEFMSQGRNFFWMLEYPLKMDEVYGNMLWNDTLRFFKLYSHSSTNLFGTEVLGRDGGSGLGFSLLGELYFSGGWSVLFIFGILTGLMMNWLRRKCFYSQIGIYIYVTVLFSCAYSLRADFANLLAGIFKLGLIPIVLLVVMVQFFRYLELMKAK